MTSLHPAAVFLDLPPKTFVGIDLVTFTSAPNFRGINGIPPGVHLIYTGTDESLSIRHGRWLKITAQAIHVLRWNKDLEHLDLLEPTSSDAQIARSKLPASEIEKQGFVNYATLADASADARKTQSQNDQVVEQEEASKSWRSLVSHITPRLILRVLADSDSTLTSVSSARGDREHIPGLSDDEAFAHLDQMAELFLLPIDLKQTWSEESIGRERTIMARDRSWYLQHLIQQLQTASAGTGGSDVSQQQAASELLGELQFCFVNVLCLANYSCLEQWKRLLNIMFTSTKALEEVEGYFVEIIKVLRLQLGRVEDVDGGLFEMGDEISSKWLRQLLRVFRDNVDERFEGESDKKGKQNDGGNKLRAALSELEMWLRDQYGWEDEKSILRRGMVQLEDGEMVEVHMDGVDEEEETGEYAPVVVEM